jgi:3-hydroxyacyl-[acyl-carrier-protein] dehydratase
MLETNFFKIKHWEKEENYARFTVVIDCKHDVFKGHFPQQPVVPGVFTLQMIKECLEIALNKKLQYSELVNCKFSRPILPKEEEEIRVNCEYTISDSVQLKATVNYEANPCLSLKANLIEL